MIFPLSNVTGVLSWKWAEKFSHSIEEWGRPVLLPSLINATRARKTSKHIKDGKRVTFVALEDGQKERAPILIDARRKIALLIPGSRNR